MRTDNRVWLCWSPQQNCLHIEPETEGLRTNQEALVRNTKVDYIPIGIFGNDQAAREAAHAIRPKLREREMRESESGCPEPE